jgi:uncharacterized protein (TIGR02246 family)
MRESPVVDESVVRATLKQYAEAWEKRDRTAWLGVFSPESSQVDPVGTEPNRGRSGIAAFWDRAMAMYSYIELRPGRIYVCENEAAMTWQIVGEDTEGWASFDGIDVFTFTPDGLIASVRAYWQQEGKQRHRSRPT